MSTPDLTQAHRLVVKVGSALLVGPEGLRHDWLCGLLGDVAQRVQAGCEVVLVSSGSIALGRQILKLPAGSLSLEQSQAAAAVGQIRLARCYEEALAPHGIHAGQVLLTLQDSQNRRRYLNVRTTLQSLLAMGVVPIVNENDTVATDEIRFGDNDRLAAQIAVMVGADQLVLLSDVDGLYTANPQADPQARHLPVVDEISAQIEDMAGDPISDLSKGGMKTKLLAARTAMAGGCVMAIAKGFVDRPLSAICAGARTTWFIPNTDPQTARKNWIMAMKSHGRIYVDAGAAQALAGGGSLLPVGVTHVEGAFSRGDAVCISDASGHALAYGLVRYSVDEAALIAGHRSEDIAAILGYSGRGPMVHRDDMGA